MNEPLMTIEEELQLMITLQLRADALERGRCPECRAYDTIVNHGRAAESDVQILRCRACGWTAE